MATHGSSYYFLTQLVVKVSLKGTYPLPFPTEVLMKCLGRDTTKKEAPQINVPVQHFPDFSGKVVEL